MPPFLEKRSKQQILLRKAVFLEKLEFGFYLYIYIYYIKQIRIKGHMGTEFRGLIPNTGSI